MSSLLLALAMPLGTAAAAAALVAGAEAFDVPLGTNQLLGGGIAYLILREVFGYLRGRQGKESRGDELLGEAGPDSRLQVQLRIAQCLDQQTGILERMAGGQAEILKVTQQYQQTGICPWTKPIERQHTIESIGAATARVVPSAGDVAEEVVERMRDDDR